MPAPDCPVDFYGIAGLVSARRRRAPLTFVEFDIFGWPALPMLELAYTGRRQLLEHVVQLSKGA